MEILRADGHKIFWVTREKDVTTKLLKAHNLSYKVLTKARRGFANMIGELIQHDVKVWLEAVRNNIDLMLGTSVSITHAGLFCKAKSWIFEEDDAQQAKLMTHLSYPFASQIITPDFLAWENHGKKHIVHPSYHEFAYLHPNHFKADKTILKDIGVKENEPYFLLRFVSLGASHDFKTKGLSLAVKRKILNRLLRHGKVFIASEGDLPQEFKPYQISVSPHRIHDLLAFCKLYIGDSQTMAIESAVLGVPSIRCNTFVGKLSIFEELDNKYGLTFGFLPHQSDSLLDKLEQLLDSKNLKEEWQAKQFVLLKDKIDLTEWLVELINGHFKKIPKHKGIV